MRRIIVLNSKGGCGKTTVATNLASCYAAKGYSTVLFDYDPQASSYQWLQRRAEDKPPIHGVSAAENGGMSQGLRTTRSWHMRLPPNTQCVVLDTPAGARISYFAPQIQESDAILLPVLASPIDIQASAAFIQDLLLVGKLRKYKTRLGIVANRLRSNTNALASLERFLNTLEIPVVARLRDAQRYISAAEQGLGVHELGGKGAYVDSLVWDATLDWIEQKEINSLAHTFTARLRSNKLNEEKTNPSCPEHSRQ